MTNDGLPGIYEKLGQIESWQKLRQAEERADRKRRDRRFDCLDKNFVTTAALNVSAD